MRNMTGVDHSDVRFAGLREGEKANSDVIKYQLSPEELAKYREDDKPKGKVQIPSIGVQVKLKVDAEVAQLTKEQYLQQRAEGKTREQILVETGWAENTLRSKRSIWGIYRDEDEEKAIEQLRMSKPEVLFPAFDFNTYDQMREEGKSQPEIAKYFGVELEDLKARVATEREAQRVPTPQAAIITIEQRSEPLNDADRLNVSPTVENAADVTPDDHDGIQYVNVRIPVRIGTPLADIVDLKRSEAFATAYHMLEQVVAWAAEDMQDLLGTADADKLQAYVDRQIG